MYWSAFRTYFMLKPFTPEGQLQYQFIDAVQSVIPFYVMRAAGGALYLAGVILMIYNLVKTCASGKFVAQEEAEAPALAKDYTPAAGTHWHNIFERKPMLMLVTALVVFLIGAIVEFVPTFLSQI
jgi:cytochrome c oxidase cbb3-type subunit I/II